MGRIGRTVRIDRIVGIAVVGNLHHFVAVAFGRLDHLLHRAINSRHSLLNCLVNTGMANHIAIGEVEADEIELLRIERRNQLVSHLIGAHLRLQVVGCHLGRRNQNSLLTGELLLTASVQEEGYVGILLGLGNTQLCKSLFRDVLADRIGHVLLVEQDVQPLELGIVRGHRAVIERHRVHSLLRHILLRQGDGQLLGPVITVVEEDHHVIRTDHADRIAVLVDPHDRLHELVGYPLVVGFLHGQHHIGRVLALTLDQQVVGLLHTLPTFVAVHGVVAADDRCDDSRRFFTHMALELLNKALAAVRVGVAAIHETMYVGMLNAVAGCNIGQFEQVLKR